MYGCCFLDKHAGCRASQLPFLSHHAHFLIKLNLKTRAQRSVWYSTQQSIMGKIIAAVLLTLILRACMCVCVCHWTVLRVVAALIMSRLILKSSLPQVRSMNCTKYKDIMTVFALAWVCLTTINGCVAQVGRFEVNLISPDSKTVVLEKNFKDISSCCQVGLFLHAVFTLKASLLCLCCGLSQKIISV